jgi:hypothetical protein
MKHGRMERKRNVKGLNKYVTESLSSSKEEEEKEQQKKIGISNRKWKKIKNSTFQPYIRRCAAPQ